MSANWIDEHRQLYLEDGEKGHMWDSTVRGGAGPVPTLLLSTVGRRSGKTSIMPLIYGDSEDGYVIIASKGGAPSHPDWYFNLQADPNVQVKLRHETFAARAHTVTDERRSGLWQLMAEIWPQYNDYQANTEREIPVVLLQRV